MFGPVCQRIVNAGANVADTGAFGESFREWEKEADETPLHDFFFHQPGFFFLHLHHDFSQLGCRPAFANQTEVTGQVLLIYISEQPVRFGKRFFRLRIVRKILLGKPVASEVLNGFGGVGKDLVVSFVYVYGYIGHVVYIRYQVSDTS